MRADSRFLKRFKTVEHFNGNGSTVVFALSTTPQENEAVSVFVNGIRREEGASNGYSLSGVNITFNTAPALAQRITVEYWKNRGE